MARLSYADLVARLSDLERLAEPPHPDERGGCHSSYDRRSRYNPATGLYEHWDANRDGDGYIRREGDRIVVFEEQGPGVIWRIWSAAPGPGHAEIYIDDRPAPAMDLPFRDLFGGVGRQDYNLPELAMTLSRGHNRYIPIPYNRSCKIRLAPDWGRYYHITYSRFPQGTELPIFTGEREDADRVLLAQKDRELARRGWSLPVHADDERTVADVTLTPGRALTVGRWKAIARSPASGSYPTPNCGQTPATPCASWRSPSAGTGSGSPASGRRWATSSAPRPAYSPFAPCL